MPQLDLDHLFRVGGQSKSKVACETTSPLPGSGTAGAVQSGALSASARADGSGAPAEPVLLRVRDGVVVGLALAEPFGAALRRDGSTKGGSNPKAAAEAATRKETAPSAAGSRRLPAAAGKSAVAVAIAIGVVLPAAGKKVAAKERRAPGRVAVGPARAWRRPAAGGARVFASEAAGAEPVSPKVSCFGAVLPETRAGAAAPGACRQRDGERSGGCWASVAAALRGLCCNTDNDPREGGEEPGASGSSPVAATPEPPPPAAAITSPPRTVAGLGDVKRLASRRWPETMAEAGRGAA